MVIKNRIEINKDVKLFATVFKLQVILFIIKMYACHNVFKDEVLFAVTI